MKFGTSIHCMDGRIQEPIINYIKANFDIEYIDIITEAGPNGVIANRTSEEAINSIHKRIIISTELHGSDHIFIAGHYDCAGNPVSKDVHLRHIDKSAEYIQSKYPEAVIVKLWVNDKWEVERL